eukprot:ctg_708.g350
MSARAAATTAAAASSVDGAIDEALYSRQLYVMGHEAQARMASRRRQTVRPDAVGLAAYGIQFLRHPGGRSRQATGRGGGAAPGRAESLLPHRTGACERMARAADAAAPRTVPGGGVGERAVAGAAARRVRRCRDRFRRLPHGVGCHRRGTVQHPRQLHLQRGACVRDVSGGSPPPVRGGRLRGVLRGGGHERDQRGRQAASGAAGERAIQFRDRDGHAADGRLRARRYRD